MRFLGRALDWRNDDELSVALSALDEAISAFRAGSAPFESFAAMVIRRRLTDFLRAREQSAAVSLDAIGEAERDALMATDAWGALRRQEEAEELREAIGLLERALRHWRLDLWEMGRTAPRHRDSRLALVEAARRWVAGGAFPGVAPARLPRVAEICRATGLTRRVAARHRAFLVAVAIVLAHPDLQTLRSHFGEGG